MWVQAALPSPRGEEHVDAYDARGGAGSRVARPCAPSCPCRLATRPPGYLRPTLAHLHYYTAYERYSTVAGPSDGCRAPLRRPPGPAPAPPNPKSHPKIWSLQVPVAAAQSSYNKDDFFDKLSCDTLERLAISDEGGCRLGGVGGGVCVCVCVCVVVGCGGGVWWWGGVGGWGDVQVVTEHARVVRGRLTRAGQALGMPDGRHLPPRCALLAPAAAAAR